MKYLYPASEAAVKNVEGVSITLFGENITTNNVVIEEFEKGRLEEFADDVSTHMWYILDGEVTFVINDENVLASVGDLVVIPPKTRIHYFGKAKMLLCTTPAFDPKNEHHIRNVDISESPYEAKV
jgi:mannose-6-phosphate isomerase-like protein (cupin superfamily)